MGDTEWEATITEWETGICRQEFETSEVPSGATEPPPPLLTIVKDTTGDDT